MANRLRRAVSPYLRSHADNPVDWQPWGSEPFAEAHSRQVPVLISIGYSTCHWCHVMARESFSDPDLAAYLNANFVSIKVDREEHPDVDSTYLAAAGAFTDQLGWPLTVFATPEGRAFYAGTYFPPVETHGLPSFRAVLEAMVEAWTERRNDIEDVAGRLAAAITSAATESGAGADSDALTESGAARLPRDRDFDTLVDDLLDHEDNEFGGFGGAPKYPVAPVIGFLLDRADAGDDRAGSLAARTLAAMSASPLRDPVEGGFFRYATKRDWSDPHYERMLYDNALLLGCYARIGDQATAEGIASFLLTTLRLASGGFASAQDSESTVDGKRVEGGYYLLDAAARSRQESPALDEKVLTGWNGLAIAALASAGARLAHRDWIDAAAAAAELVSSGDLVRARIDSRISSARATLEDFGMLACGLIELALATGEARYAVRARELVASTITSRGFAVPGGGDPVLSAHGLLLPSDPSEGAYPSGISSIATAAVRLARLGADGAQSSAFATSARTAMAAIAPLVLERPIAFGGALGALSLLASTDRALVVVTDAPAGPLASSARSWRRGLVAIVSLEQSRAFADAGFELFAERSLQGGQPTAYLCENFVCQLPVTDVAALDALLAG
jgi:hypothetical protein